MEPLHPKLREALKQAHPGLTDDDIDQHEELLVHRMQLDPEKDRDKIQRLDLERAELIRQKMPHYEEIARVFTAKAVRPKAKQAPKVKIKRPRHR